MCIDFDGGRHAGREGPGRNKEGWRVGGREQGEDGEGERGGREEAMILGRERASVEEGSVEGGWVDEGTEPGMDSARERWEGGSEQRTDWARKGGSIGGRGTRAGRKRQGRYPEEGSGQGTVYSQTIPQRSPRP